MGEFGRGGKIGSYGRSYHFRGVHHDIPLILSGVESHGP